MNLKPLLGAVTAATMAAVSPAAFAFDIDAGDYTALPAGTNLAAVYYRHQSYNALYAGGDKVPIEPKLTADVGILRLVHFMELGGYTIDPQFALPFGRLKASGDIAPLGSTSSVGDLIVASTLWFNKPGEKENVGVTGFLFLPTGQYDRNDPLSLGENRWKLTLNAGWIKPLTDNVTMDLIGDVTLFGKNDDFGPSGATMKQKPLLQFQAMWRYHLSPAADLRFGVSHLNGGETKVDGVAQNDKLSNTRFWVGGSLFVSPTTQLLATVGRDGDVRQGFKQNAGVQLRLLQLF